MPVFYLSEKKCIHFYIRYRSRFFPQVGHEFTYGCSENYHFYVAISLLYMKAKVWLCRFFICLKKSVCTSILDTVQYFFYKLGMKSHMVAVKIIIFISLYLCYLCWSMIMPVFYLSEKVHVNMYYVCMFLITLICSGIKQISNCEIWFIFFAPLIIPMKELYSTLT